MSRNHQVETAGPADTSGIGRRIGEGVNPSTLITLDGPLGVGKTVLARGIAEGLGVTAWRGSPTYNLVHEYQGRLPLFHIDAYRISSPEMTDLDMDRLTESQGVVVVEWADNVPEAMANITAQRVLRVRIVDLGGDERRVEIRE